MELPVLFENKVILTKELEDYKNQCVKLVYKFAYGLVKKESLEKFEVDNFVNYAFLYLLESKSFEKYILYKKDELTFGSYIYNLLRWNLKSFIYQTKYDIPYNYARKIAKDDDERTLFIKSNYENTLYNVNQDVEIPDINEAVSDDNIEKEVEEKYITNDFFTNYIKNNEKLNEKQKEIILFLLEDDHSVAICAKKFGRSRQGIYNIIYYFEDLIKEDKELCDVLFN